MNYEQDGLYQENYCMRELLWFRQPLVFIIRSIHSRPALSLNCSGCICYPHYMNNNQRSE